MADTFLCAVIYFAQALGNVCITLGRSQPGAMENNRVSALNIGDRHYEHTRAAGILVRCFVLDNGVSVKSSSWLEYLIFATQLAVTIRYTVMCSIWTDTIKCENQLVLRIISSALNCWWGVDKFMRWKHTRTKYISVMLQNIKVLLWCGHVCVSAHLKNFCLTCKPFFGALSRKAMPC